MKRTILDCVTISTDVTRLAAAVAQNANYGEKYAEIAELHAMDILVKLNETVRALNEVISRQHEVHDDNRH